MTALQTRLSALRQTLSGLQRRTKRLVMRISDVIAVAVAAVAAHWLANVWVLTVPELAATTLIVTAVAVPAFATVGLYRSIVRFMGLDLVVMAFKGVLVSALVVLVVSAAWTAWPEAVRVTLVFFALALVYVAGSRFAVRLFFQAQRVPGDRVIIYGAGAAGAQLASAISGGQDYVPVAFVDDNASQIGTVVSGLEVYAPAELPRLVSELGASRVLLAMPSASRGRRRRILSRLEELSVHVQTLPDFSDLISGHARVDEIREVDVADLLGRDPVPPNEQLFAACIHQRSVLVTGAGGSIGSELCRQILKQSPKRLLLLEISEAALYLIDRELRRVATSDKLPTEIIPLLGSAHHRNRVRDVLRAYAVDTVYHAAAYKHVPLVEHNMIEGVHNNVFGTLHTAQACIEAGVSSFVLVSTDKAVCPTNVMGATKRLSELVLQGLNDRGCPTNFSMVRFGNVLASSGSVVPLFREQIRAGGPVTVTHPEIIRYFMTIPEAAQLVIQAGSMAQGGDVFVLDMGKPVRIKDLAEKMIHLMGLTVKHDDNPEGDIEIQYTGLRPAEKLYEELLIGNNVMGTEHPMIMRAEEDLLAWTELQPVLDELWESCMALDCERARQLLLTTVAGYTPTVGLEDLVWRERNRGSATAAVAAVEPATVTDLKTWRH